MVAISELWSSGNAELWDQSLRRYWELVMPKNFAIEQELENLQHQQLHSMNAQEWYEFLLNEYFRWKYTAANRYATTTTQLKRYVTLDALNELLEIKSRLLAIDPSDVRLGLKTGIEIRGLGTAGASGLLSLLYPSTFATVDQFVVKALREVPNIAEMKAVRAMNPEGLTISDGVKLIKLMTDKSQELNHKFKLSTWTPRKIDKILWTYGRD